MTVEKLIIELQKLVEINHNIADYEVGYFEPSHDSTYHTMYVAGYDTVDEIEIHSDDNLIRFV